jgi:hypothetical protein
MLVANGAQVVEFLVCKRIPELIRINVGFWPSRHLLQLHKGGRDRRTADIADGL